MLKNRTRIKKTGVIIIGLIVLLIAIQYGPKVSLTTSKMVVEESDLINFYYVSEDQNVIDEIKDDLQVQAELINQTLIYDNQEKTNIYIYPNQNQFHRKKYGSLIDVIKIFQDLSWYVGDNVKENVVIVSPNNPGDYHDKETVIGVIPHEYVHTIIYRINPDTPLWINEGLALYLTNGAALDYVVESMLPSFDNIQTDNSIEFSNMGGYTYAHTYIDYLSQTYGFDLLMDFLHGSQSYETYYNKTAKELYGEWIVYLLDTYQ